MGRARRSGRGRPPPYLEALGVLSAHFLLGPVAKTLTFVGANPREESLAPGSYCRIDISGLVRFNEDLPLPAQEWLGIFSLVTLVFAVGAPGRLPVPSRVSDLAAQLGALYWWHELRVGALPENIALPPEYLQWGRQPVDEIARRLAVEPVDEILDGSWTLTRSTQPLLVKELGLRPTYRSQPIDHEGLFAEALVENAKRALQLHHDGGHRPRPGLDPNSTGARARRWLINHYPLLGSLLAGFDIIEDAALCERMRISIAAIQVATGEIYLNPLRRLSLEQTRFVLAHEALHAGLNHASRRQGRDPLLWNVACDFVINDWLLGMNVGVAPDSGLLFDETFRGLPAEDIYQRLAADIRLRRKLVTLRGQDVDILDGFAGRHFTDREEFCRRALLQGLDFHQAGGRGLLPAGLVEAIRTLNQPAIPWQARLAEWIREQCPLPEQRRTWARPSRRQSATPDIPRPRFFEPTDETISRTYGVIIDTSGSMDRAELGKALGAIVAYSEAQRVRQVRLVYCDAQPYDAGFVTVDSLASRVQVRGRGGTVLQAAVDLLERRPDFPKDCPILVITDGGCESDLRVTREHAFLLSPGRRLPFPTRKPVFEMK